MRTLLLSVLVGVTFATSHAAILIAPISGQFPDVFTGYCASGCTQLAYELSAPELDTSSTFTATLAAAVYVDPNNTFCAGCLDFVYQISNSAGSTDGIGRVTAVDFTGFEVDAGYSLTAPSAGGGTAFVDGSAAPGLVDRNTANTVGFQFESSPTGAIAPGATSNVLIIETDATEFTVGLASAIDGGGASFSAFEPAGSTSSTPEPASALMLGFGMAAVASLKLFRRGN